MKTSEKIDLIAKALAEVQSEVENILVDATNPHFKNKYTSLESILKAIRPQLTSKKLAIIQMPSTEGGRHSLTTSIMHESGQFISSTMDLILQKNDMQGLGSAITYARRYMVESFLGFTKTEDDDGNAASFKPSQQEPKQSLQKILNPNGPQEEKPGHPTSAELGYARSATVERIYGLGSDYEITFGKKYKGKKFSDLDAYELDGYLQFFKGEQAKGSKIGQQVLDFMQAAEAYLASMETNPREVDESEEIPF